MSRGKLSRFCRIYHWIENKDANFAEALRDLCLEGLLGPNKSCPQVTFLYPLESDRKNIVSLAYSDKADEAIRLVKSYIVPDLVTEKSRVLGNKLRIAFELKKSGNNILEFEGFKIKKAVDFYPLKDYEHKITVWCVTEGNPPVTGNTYTPTIRGSAEMMRRSTRGGDEVVNNRLKLAESLKAKHFEAFKKSRAVIDSPYLPKVIGFLNYILIEKEKSNPVYVNLVQKIAPSLDYCPMVTFYLLFEPHKKCDPSEYLVPNEVFESWMGANIATTDSLPLEYHSYITKAIAGWPNCLAARDASRIKVARCSEPTQCLPTVLADYKKLEETNTITNADGTDVNNILPAEAHEHYSKCPGKKLWQDEFRFTFGEYIACVLRENSIETDLNPLNKVYESILCWPGNDYTAETVICNEQRLATTCAPRMDLLQLVKFVNSTDYLYVPVGVPMEVRGAAEGSMAMNKGKLYDRNARTVQFLKQMVGSPNTSKDGLSKKTMVEVAAYLQRHHRLPEDLEKYTH